MTLWTDHITKFSKKHNIPLKEAMSNPKCKREYEKMKKKKGIISPKKKNKKRLNYGGSSGPPGPPGPGGGAQVPDEDEPGDEPLRSNADPVRLTSGESGEINNPPKNNSDVSSPKIFKPSKRSYNRKKK